MKAVLQRVVIIQTAEKVPQPYSALRIGEYAANGSLRQTAFPQRVALVYRKRIGFLLIYVERIDSAYP